MWSLLYCSKINEKEACAEVIKDLINLFNQDSYSLDKIKSLYHEIKEVGQVDLYKLCTNASNYEDGYRNFINNIEDFKIEWWDELQEELSHLQSEIAFRKEDDVEKCVLHLIVNKNKKPEPIPSSGGMAVEPESATPPVQAKPDDIKKAKTLVREQTMPSMMWQKVVLDLIEEHPEVSQFLISYLGS